MEIFCMQQRKGKFVILTIDTITEDDVPMILEYLKPRLKHLIELWSPLNLK
jgi:hypothetical protein